MADASLVAEQSENTVVEMVLAGILRARVISSLRTLRRCDEKRRVG
jgi:hypothetical protein